MEKSRAIDLLDNLIGMIEDNQDNDYDTAFRMAIEALKEQLSKECTTSDMISRTATIDAVNNAFDRETLLTGFVRSIAVRAIRDMPSAQPVATDTNVGDKISKFIDGLEEIFAHIRERHVDDSVCGLCEYDGAYMGQSGDWCNECPGFDRDDCFKLSDETRKKWTDEIINALPTIQPEPQWIPISDRLPRDGTWNIFTDGKDISVERYKADAIDHFFPNGRWFQLEDATAWMPLPEAYKPNNK